MKYTIRLVGIVGLLVVASACADDGNDVRVQAERAERLAAEFAADPSEPIVVTDPSEPTGDDSTDTETTDDTETAADTEATVDGADTDVEPDADAIEPTGVVIAVSALDNSFRPDVIEVSVGDQVLWENRGINEHDVLQVSGDDWGIEVEDFQPGDVYVHTFTEPGEYNYFCSIHGIETVGMIGTVIVTA